MQTIERNKCVISHADDLELLYKFNNFPVFMGCTLQPESEDIVAEMIWSISASSGFIQLTKLIPLEILYQSQHAGSTGKIWADHHLKFAHFIGKFNPSSVFEIGGAHGILANEYRDNVNKINWTILEPNPKPIKESSAKFIKGFFNGQYILDDKYDTIVHSHVLEHVYEHNSFIEQLSKFMNNGERLIFSVPNLYVTLERKYTNCINFEHTTFLTEPYIEYILSINGFRIVDKQYFLEDHSIFYSAVKDITVEKINLPNGLYEKNKKIFNEFIEYHESLILNLNNILHVEKRPIYLFGAHVFAQYLIAFGLDTARIVSILDNDPNKHSKRLYGTNLSVSSPKILKDVENPVVILKAGVYNEEIKKDILSNINSRVEFWE